MFVTHQHSTYTVYLYQSRIKCSAFLMKVVKRRRHVLVYMGFSELCFMLIIDYSSRNNMDNWSFLILYLHLGHWGRLRQFGVFEAEKEEEARSAQEQRQELRKKVKGSLQKGWSGGSMKKHIQTLPVVSAPKKHQSTEKTKLTETKHNGAEGWWERGDWRRKKEDGISITHNLNMISKISLEGNVCVHTWGVSNLVGN